MEEDVLINIKHIVEIAPAYGKNTCLGIHMSNKRSIYTNTYTSLVSINTAISSLIKC